MTNREKTRFAQLFIANKLFRIQQKKKKKKKKKKNSKKSFSDEAETKTKVNLMLITLKIELFGPTCLVSEQLQN